MRQTILAGIFIVICLVFVLFWSILPAAAQENDVLANPSCPLCGMDRQKFAHSRMLIIYDSGGEFGSCSLHCAAVNMAVQIDRTPTMIKAGDFNTHRLIDAETAFWVIGGDKPGVMTKRAKWAFQEKSDADTFINEHGGTLVHFDAAVKAAFSDMAEDTVMIRKKRKAMRMKMEQAKLGMTPVPPLPGAGEKCPVCGMFVAKYPRWIGVITFAGNSTAYFDGAKDLFKYLFDLENYRPDTQTSDIQNIHVTEYYDVRLIPAKTAFFVVGSDVYGPMGTELIPFASMEDANTFLADHGGRQVVTFSEVTPELIAGFD